MSQRQGGKIMNKKYLFVILLSFGFVACTTTGPIDPADCVAYSGPMPPCNSMQDPAAPAVTLNTNSLNVTPYCVRARVGSEIVIRLVPVAKNELGDAVVFPKNPADTWLAGTNDTDKDEIRIPVPDELPVGDHDYGFRVNNDCVDPRVHIEL